MTIHYLDFTILFNNYFYFRKRKINIVIFICKKQYMVTDSRVVYVYCDRDYSNIGEYAIIVTIWWGMIYFQYTSTTLLYYVLHSTRRNLPLSCITIKCTFSTFEGNERFLWPPPYIPPPGRPHHLPIDYKLW